MKTGSTLNTPATWSKFPDLRFEPWRGVQEGFHVNSGVFGKFATIEAFMALPRGVHGRSSWAQLWPGLVWRGPTLNANGADQQAMAIFPVGEGRVMRATG